MANIYSYPQIGELADADNLIISDASNGNKTKSVTIEQLSDYFGPGGGGSSVYSKLQTSISFQDLLLFNGQASYAKEIELVAAPGANKVIIIDSVFAYMQPGTTAFDFNTLLSIGLSGQQNSGLFPKATIQASVLNSSIGNALNYIDDANIYGPFPETSPPGYNYTNKGIVLTNPFATTVSQGNSTLKLNIVYRVVNI